MRFIFRYSIDIYKQMRRDFTKLMMCSTTRNHAIDTVDWYASWTSRARHPKYHLATHIDLGYLQAQVNSENPQAEPTKYDMTFRSGNDNKRFGVELNHTEGKHVPAGDEMWLSWNKKCIKRSEDSGLHRQNFWTSNKSWTLRGDDRTSRWHQSNIIPTLEKTCSGIRIKSS